MLEWLNRLFGAPTSSSIAKDRLRLVLLSDHLALAPEVIDALRKDLIEVISRYVEVDEKNSDVSFEHKDAGVAMLANIPILSVKPRPTPPPPEEASELPSVGTNGHAPADGVMAAEPIALDHHDIEITAVEAILEEDQSPPDSKPRRKRKTSGLPRAAPAQ